MNNRNVIRSLAHLQDSASTARVLNLHRIHKLNADNAEHGEDPMFRNPILNRSLIIKHRLRRDELDLFGGERLTATKLIIPIDSDDLRIGGRAVFVGQQNYAAIMTSLFGDHWTGQPTDRELLDILDEIPSFDPFLLREHLRRHNRYPARCYFELSDADMQRMFTFVESQVRRLVDLCYKSASGSAQETRSSRLVEKILSSKVDEGTEPLRLTLRLEKREYEEGVFCWKGFLYYKWSLAEALPLVDRVAHAIENIRPRLTPDPESRIDLERSRAFLGQALFKLCQKAEKSLRVYDDAFTRLTDGEPQAFRDFLLSAPTLFTNLGHQLGALNHVISFWRFRFPDNDRMVVGFEELQDIFRDFEDSLSIVRSPIGIAA